MQIVTKHRCAILQTVFNVLLIFSYAYRGNTGMFGGLNASHSCLRFQQYDSFSVSKFPAYCADLQP